MKVLFWNVGKGNRRGPTPDALAWLRQAEWDLAVLAEVNRDGLERLKAEPWSLVVAGQPKGHRLAVVVVARDGLSVDRHPSDLGFTTREGLYEYRALATRVRAGDQEWTVVGAHMPNSWVGDRKDHSFKEHCYAALRTWLEELENVQRVVVAMDSNRGSWELSTKAIKERTREVQTFLQDPSSVGLRDAFLAANPTLTTKPATYWNSGPEYFDRLFVSPDVTVQTCEVLLSREALGSLSDHAPVAADVLG